MWGESPQLVDAPLSYFHPWVGTSRLLYRQRAERPCVASIYMCDVMQCSAFCLELIIYSNNLKSFPFQRAEK